jgi:hypothetical protein
VDPPLPRGLVRVRLSFDLGGKVQSNVLHFIPPGGWSSAADLAAFIQVISQWWDEPGGPQASPSSFQGSAANVVNLLARYLPIPATGPAQWIGSLVKALVLNGPSPGVPSDSCPVLHLDTSGDWGPRTGRLYFCGVRADYLTGLMQDRLNPNQADNLAATFSGLPAFLAYAYAPNPPPTWVVWRRSKQVGGPLAMPVVSTVTGVRIPSLVLGSQRCRLSTQRHYDREAS